MIAILIPVLARPANAARVAASIAASTTVPHRVFFVCNSDDREQISTCLDIAGVLTLYADWQSGPGDYAKKMQLAYDLTTEPFVFTGADDLDFRPGWDTAALAAIESGPYGVCGTDDCANPTVKAGRHSTHSLVRRAYVDGMGATFDRKPGVLFHDGYDHAYVDNELVEVAKSRGQWVFARDSQVAHRHWIWRTAEKDSTYEKAGAHMREDTALFTQRLRQWKRERVAA